MRLEHPAAGPLFNVRRLRKVKFEGRRYGIPEEVKTQLRSAMTRKTDNITTGKGTYKIDAMREKYSRRRRLAKQRERRCVLRSSCRRV